MVGCSSEDMKMSIEDMFILLKPAAGLEMVRISSELVEILELTADGIDWVREMCTRWPRLQLLTICDFGCGLQMWADSTNLLYRDCVQERRNSVDINCRLVRVRVAEAA